MLQQDAVEPATLELLKRICSAVPFDNFALGGGTNLALRLGHRLSVDLNFFVTHRIRIVLFFGPLQAGFGPQNCCLSKIKQ